MRWRRTVALTLFGTLAVLAHAMPAAAQAGSIRFTGRGDVAIDTVLERIVRSGRYRPLTADTVYPASDTIRGPILIAATTAKFEGVILGDVAIVDANVFLRPGSRITGDVVSIAAGLFSAPGSSIDGTVREWKEAHYSASLESFGVRITGSRVASRFNPDGFGGFHAPRYDRVAGLSTSFGARYLLPRIGLAEPDIHGRVGYQTAREHLIGGLDVGLRRGSYRLTIGVETNTFTNDEWVRGWTNSITYLWSGRDYRDYFIADRYFVRQVLSRSTLYSVLDFSLTASVEDARSLPNRDPWHALHDIARPNPFIDDGRITSLNFALDGRWEHDTWVSIAHAGIETASTVLDGDASFTRFDAGGEVAVQALADQTLRVKWRFRGPIGSDSLPRQRWNVIGGPATLPTLDTGELHGDRLIWVETDYDIPVPGIRLPILERPSFDLLHRIGSAWTAGADRELIQNVGVRLQLRFLWLAGFVDPANTDRTVFDIGLSLPGRYPWTRVE